MLSTAQRDIIKAGLSGEVNTEGNPLVIVSAVAGAGKSILATQLARQDSTRQILFLAQSRNLIDRAKQTLPANVSARTLYEAAKQYITPMYREKLDASKVVKKPNFDTLKKLGFVRDFETYMRAMTILELFMRSPDPFPSKLHLPVTGQDADWVLLSGDVANALNTAERIWSSMASYSPDSAPLSYASIVKIWSQGKPYQQSLSGMARTMQISPITNDIGLVIVEEAQDLTRGLVHFLSRQRCSVILVGDGFQALRKGELSIQHLNHSLHKQGQFFSLQDSYRFGPSVASVANALTHKGGAPTKERLTGLGSSAVHPLAKRFDWEDMGQHYIFLTSSSPSLFTEAYEATRRGRSIAWLDGIESYPITLLRDLVILGSQSLLDGVPSQNELIKTPWVKNASCLNAVINNTARFPYSAEHQLALWVQSYLPMGNLLQIVNGWIKSDQHRQQHNLKYLNEPLERQITLGTVIRAKGHEWPRVALCESLFPAWLSGHTWAVQKSNVVLNTAYVAVTRAQYHLALPSMFTDHLQQHGWTIHPNDAIKDSDIEKSERCHPYFGLARHALLEMHPHQRQRRSMSPTGSRKHSIASGQHAIRLQMEAGAQKIHKEGGSLRDVLTSRRKNTDNSRT
jgi:hypothetical protein